MTELTTGVVFLMSSLYGAGHASANLATIAQAADTSANTTQVRTIETSDTSSLKENRKIAKTEADNVINDVEGYVKLQYEETPILVEVARCESGFHQFNTDGTVVRGIVNKQDVGVMQINEKYHADYAEKLGYNIYTVEGNVAFAKFLYKQYGTDPWKFSSKCWSGYHIAEN